MVKSFKALSACVLVVCGAVNALLSKVGGLMHAGSLWPVCLKCKLSDVCLIVSLSTTLAW